MPTGEECATKEELVDFFNNNIFTLLTTINFVDYGKVNSNGNHIEKLFEPYYLTRIYPENIGT